MRNCEEVIPPRKVPSPVLPGVEKDATEPEAPMRAEFLQKRLISAFFGFQWQNLAEILRLFKKYDNL